MERCLEDFLPAVAVGILGIALVRAETRKMARAEGKLALNIESIENSLGQIVKNMGRLKADEVLDDPYEVRHRIDDVFTDDLNTFVEARESITHVYGLQGYADVMSYFAAGERYLNRVWSASADGYIDEIRIYLERAEEQFSESLEKLKQLKQRTPSIPPQ